MQKYKFSNPTSIVEVTRIGELEPAVFSCLCRGFGQNNKAPRKRYVIDSPTPAAAARLAIEKYRKDYAEMTK